MNQSRVVDERFDCFYAETDAAILKRRSDDYEEEPQVATEK